MKLTITLFACAAAATLLVAGCKKPPTPKVPMASPPAFGSKPELSTAKGFVVGRWGVEMFIDPSTPKLPGMDALIKQFQEDTKDQKIVDVINFKEDGTVRLSGGTAGHKVEGKWTEQGGLINLTFDTLDSKPFQDRMAEIKKEEESGREASLYASLAAENLEKKLGLYQQLKLSTDKKFLVFQGPGIMGGVEDNGFRLVRLEPVESN